MSAYNHRPPGHVISINNDDLPGAGIAAQGDRVRNMHFELDTYMDITRQVETALAQGRATCNRIKDELAQLHARNEEAGRGFERRNREVLIREDQLKEQLGSFQENERKLQAALGLANQQALQLREEIARAQAKTEEIRTNYEAKLDKISEPLRAEISATQRQLTELRQITDAKLAFHAQREEKVKTAIMAYRARESELAGKITQLNEALTAARGEITLYKNSWAQVLETDRDAKQYMTRKSETDAEIRKLKEALTASTEVVSKTKAAAQAKIHSMQQEMNASMQIKITTMQQELQAAAQTISKVKTAAQVRITSLYQELQKTKADSETLIQALREDLVSVKSQVTQIETAAPVDSRLESLASQFAEISNDRKEMQKEREGLEKQLASEIFGSRSPEAKRRPLRDLVAHKEAELARATRTLREVQSDNPDRKKAEAIVETLAEQRDQLRRILIDAETR